MARTPLPGQGFVPGPQAVVPVAVVVGGAGPDTHAAPVRQLFQSLIDNTRTSDMHLSMFADCAGVDFLVVFFFAAAKPADAEAFLATV